MISRQILKATFKRKFSKIPNFHQQRLIYDFIRLKTLTLLTFFKKCSKLGLQLSFTSFSYFENALKIIG